MKKFLKITAPILVLVASVFFVQTLIAAKPKPEKKEPEPRLVSLFVDEVKSEEVTLSVKSQGEVKPKTEIDLISRVSGEVVAISNHFAEGAEFATDDVLIKIDDTDYKLAVVSAEARLASAKVALERELANAKIKEKQWKLKKKSTKPSDYALNKSQVAEARANIRAAQADLQKAKLNVERTEIKVPFNGRVEAENIGIGQFISQGTTLGRVFSTDKVEIKLPLTDSQLNELGLPLGFMADESNAPIVQLHANLGKNKYSWQGKIVRTNASIDQQTRLIYAIAEVENPYQQGSNPPLAVGLYVNAEISKNHAETALSIPRVALHSNDKVYVINDEDRLEIRTVDVLSTTDTHALLASGVQAGERVVTSTLSGAAVDGMQVIAMNRDQTASVQ